MKSINVMTKIHTDKGKKVLKEPFYFLKWIFKVELIILAIFLIIGIIFNSISDRTKFAIKYNIEKTFCFDVNNSEYTYDDIIKALNTNGYMGREEKSFIANILKKEVEENINFIDMKKAIKRIKNLKVFYYKKYYYNEKKNKYELDNPQIAYMNVAGNYNAVFNKISMYEENDFNLLPVNYNQLVFDFEESNKNVYFHELNHLITKNTLSTTMNTLAGNLEKKDIKHSDSKLWRNISNSIQVVNKNIFSETINELFTKEYFNEYLQKNNKDEKYESYKEYMIYAYALAEILPEETLRKYKFNDNESILISGLLEIDNNIDEAYKLITSINSISLDDNISKTLQEEYYKKIHDGYEYFYEKKYNKKISDDLTMLLYFYGTPIQTREERNKIRSVLEMQPYDEITNVVPKGYFSKDYKNMHSNVQIEYTKNGQKQFIQIDDIYK